VASTDFRLWKYLILPFAEALAVTLLPPGIRVDATDRGFTATSLDAAVVPPLRELKAFPR
jgi:hypothetical protein